MLCRWHRGREFDVRLAAVAESIVSGRIFFSQIRDGMRIIELNTLKTEKAI